MRKHCIKALQRQSNGRCTNAELSTARFKMVFQCSICLHHISALLKANARKQNKWILSFKFSYLVGLHKNDLKINVHKSLFQHLSPHLQHPAPSTALPPYLPFMVKYLPLSPNTFTPGSAQSQIAMNLSHWYTYAGYNRLGLVHNWISLHQSFAQNWWESLSSIKMNYNF